MDRREERPVIASTDSPTQVNSSSVIKAISSMNLTASVVAAPNHKTSGYIRYRIDESPSCNLSYTPFAISSCGLATVTPKHGSVIQAYVSPFI